MFKPYYYLVTNKEHDCYITFSAKTETHDCYITFSTKTEIHLCFDYLSVTTTKMHFHFDYKNNKMKSYFCFWLLINNRNGNAFLWDLTLVEICFHLSLHKRKKKKWNECKSYELTSHKQLLQRDIRQCNSLKGDEVGERRGEGKHKV